MRLDISNAARIAVFPVVSENTGRPPYRRINISQEDGTVLELVIRGRPEAIVMPGDPAERPEITRNADGSLTSRIPPVPFAGFELAVTDDAEASLLAGTCSICNGDLGPGDVSVHTKCLPF